MEQPVDDFMAWLNEHYEMSVDGIFCRRCGQSVGYVTKHAALRHGDAIEVLPPASHALPETVDLW